MDLDSEWWTAPCPKCGAPARHGHVEQLEGGCINAYHPVSCTTCGHYDGFWDDL
ncbi:hypothetical protein [Sphingomonas sp. SORGH_AS_0742]|nr:hypothetical protein [Sphingomonas sp. SORGH_AS_0742]